MKKFRFLIFTLILTSVFIGCAQPTDDTPIIPVSEPEAQPTDNQATKEDLFYYLENDVRNALVNNESQLNYTSLEHYKINKFGRDELWVEEDSYNLVDSESFNGTCFVIGEMTIIKAHYEGEEGSILTMKYAEICDLLKNLYKSKLITITLKE